MVATTPTFDMILATNYKVKFKQFIKKLLINIIDSETSFTNKKNNKPFFKEEKITYVNTKSFNFPHAKIRMKQH